MKTGYAHWLVRSFFTALVIAINSSAWAQALTWSDRITKETSDGEIVDTQPFVKIGSVGFSRFADMQRIHLHQTLRIESGEDIETLYVFTVWQGGASQGEQLMLVSVSENGVDVIGPYEQDFETLVVKPATSEFGPRFELIGAGSKNSLAKLEYFDGQLLEQE